jgi:branched-chain amino acid transport system permease protein
MQRLYGFFIFAAATVMLPVFFPDNYYVTVVGVTTCFNIILAISLNLLMGYAGQISLGHAAFFGIGAYASAILTTRYGINPWFAMLAGAMATATLAWSVSRPILKLKGHYLAMATLGLGIIIHIVFVQADTFTGGPDGMSGIPELTIAGFAINSDLKWYAVTACCMLFTVWISLNIISSRPGRALAAIHGSEVAAEMAGIDTASVKTGIFVFSTVIASVAGSLFAHQQAFVSPESFSFFYSIELVTMVVLGGLASTFGAVMGAVILSLLPEFLVVFEDFEVMIYGAVLMTIMIFLPEGLFVAMTKQLQAIKRGK